MMTNIVGWSSSSILLLAIGSQVWQQWRTGMGEGVSMWLYVGQIAASVGFTLYSVLAGDWVFIVTNALLLLSALVGLYILLFRCQRGRARRAARASAAGAAGIGAAAAPCKARPRLAAAYHAAGPGAAVTRARRALQRMRGAGWSPGRVMLSHALSACGESCSARAGSRAGSYHRCHRRDPG